MVNVGELGVDLDSEVGAAALDSTGNRLTVGAAPQETAAASPVVKETDAADAHSSPSKPPTKKRSAQQDIQ